MVGRGCLVQATDMFRHRGRKSRKNILSLIESAQHDPEICETENDSKTSEANKRKTEYENGKLSSIGRVYFLQMRRMI